MACKNDYSIYVGALSPLEKKLFYKVQKRLHKATAAVITEAVNKMRELYKLDQYDERAAIQHTLRECWLMPHGGVSVGAYAVPIEALKQQTSVAIDEFMAKVNELSDELDQKEEPEDEM